MNKSIRSKYLATIIAANLAAIVPGHFIILIVLVHTMNGTRIGEVQQVNENFVPIVI